MSTILDTYCNGYPNKYNLVKTDENDPKSDDSLAAIKEELIFKLDKHHSESLKTKTFETFVKAFHMKMKDLQIRSSDRKNSGNCKTDDIIKEIKNSDLTKTSDNMLNDIKKELTKKIDEKFFDLKKHENLKADQILSEINHIYVDLNKKSDSILYEIRNELTKRIEQKISELKG